MTTCQHFPLYIIVYLLQTYQKERRRLFRRMEDAEMTVVICRRELALAKKAVWAERLRQRYPTIKL